MAKEKRAPLQPSNADNVWENAAENQAAAATKTIEETYQKLSQLEHILLRPDTYIGSVEKHTQKLWVWEHDQMVYKEIEYVPGLYKIFDEILVNAADNKQRDPSMDSLTVDIDPENNSITVFNNGDGVPVQIHQEEGIYVPEMIFGHLLTSSNYDDTQKKTTGGRNGYGAKLANIFSTQFVIETADGNRKKHYKQVFSNNMGNKSDPIITNLKKAENWTKVSFKPDLSKFKMTSLEDDVVALMKKRVVDMAGCLGSSVKVKLNGQTVAVSSFLQYANLYLASCQDLDMFREKVNDRWEICVCMSPEKVFQQVSFVNSIATIKGGTHVEYVTGQITRHLANVIKKKNKDITLNRLGFIKNHMWVFVNSLIDNPAFDSQTKETLTTKHENFGSICKLSENFLKKVAGSKELVESLLLWADSKLIKELKTKDGGKRQKVKVPKLEDANEAGTKNAAQCTLILTEGDSAKALALSGISVVGRDHYGVFPLRGKLLNVREASLKQITENAEISHMKTALGLQTGLEYGDDKNYTKLRYGHVMIMTDQDHDGSHIKGLLINFIHSFWPSLLKRPEFLVEFITPIVKATNKKNVVKAFYTMPEYEAWKENDLKKKATGEKEWTIKYYKGLGTSTSKEGQQYFSDLTKHKKDFVWVDEQDGDAIHMAFSKKQIEARKNWLRHFEPGTYLDQKETQIKYRDFVNKELILFSMADLQRSIPSSVDGLKPGQRKILFCAFKRDLKKEVKVAQFSGYVSEHSAYHHGETSLAGTIIGMAQDFVGSNNINLLQPNGQFGTRLQGGKDNASPRYVFTCLSPVTRFLFPKDDDALLNYLDEDEQKIEPTWYVPIIPMVLVNGSEGIGTGWSSYVPNYNPRDIVSNVRRLLNGEPMEPLHPWYKGFKGTIEQTATREGGVTYTVTGIIEEIDETKLRITELPVRRWTQDYKEFLDSIDKSNVVKVNNTKSKDKDKGIKTIDKVKEKFIEEYKDHSDDTTVDLEVIISEEDLLMAKKEGLVKKFKLTTNISTSNMHLFDANGVIKKYDTPEQIIEDFFHIRLDFYEKRKEVLVDKLQVALLILDNKVRFILGVVSGEIIVSNRKRADLFLELHQKGFTPVTKKIKNVEVVSAETENVEEAEESIEVTGDGLRASDYDYLLRMPIGTLTLEKVQELCAQKDRMESELDELRGTPPKSLWLKDLDALDNALDELDKADAESEVERRKFKRNQINEAGKKGAVQVKKPRNNTKKAALTEKVAATVNAPTEIEDAVEPVKPKGRGGARKAPAKKQQKPIQVESDEDEMHELNERLAQYNIKDSSPDQSPATETEETEANDEDSGLQVVGKKGGKKPAANAKTGKAAAAARKRGPATKQLANQKLITDALNAAEASPDKKVRKIRASPFNKKSGSMLGKFDVSEEKSGSSSCASGSPEEVSEVAARQRPQRATRQVKNNVIELPDDTETESEDEGTDDSDFDANDD